MIGPKEGSKYPQRAREREREEVVETVLGGALARECGRGRKNKLHARAFDKAAAHNEFEKNWSRIQARDRPPLVTGRRAYTVRRRRGQRGLPILWLKGSSRSLPGKSFSLI